MPGFDIRPLTPNRWDDCFALFGERGAYAGCWCMWWRIPAAAFDEGARQRGAGNRRRFEALVAEGRLAPGVLAFAGDETVGWCSIGPKSDFGRLQRSPTLAPVEAVPDAWSIVCLYIDRRWRRRGVAAALVDGALAFAGEYGASTVEAYPITDPADAASAYTGVPSLFERAGFVEVPRKRGGRRLLMRRQLGS